MKRFSKGCFFDQIWYINGYDLIPSSYKALLRSFQPPTTLSLRCLLCAVSRFERFESKSALGGTKLTFAKKDIFLAGACLFSAETSGSRKYVCFRRVEPDKNLGTSKNCRVDHYFSNVLVFRT